MVRGLREGQGAAGDGCEAGRAAAVWARKGRGGGGCVPGAPAAGVQGGCGGVEWISGGRWWASDGSRHLKTIEKRWGGWKRVGCCTRTPSYSRGARWRTEMHRAFNVFYNYNGFYKSRPRSRLERPPRWRGPVRAIARSPAMGSSRCSGRR